MMTVVRCCVLCLLLLPGWGALAQEFDQTDESAETTSDVESDGEDIPLDAADGGNPVEDRFRLSAAVTAWSRGFFKDAEFQGQRENRVFPFLEGWVRFDANWNDGRDRVSVQPYARVDFLGSFSRFDFNHAYYLHTAENWDVLVGVQTVSWGVVESQHLVDVVNQVDLGGDIDQEDRLGQPMVNLNLVSADYGTLSLYGLFGFRERDHPNVKDRVRQAIAVSDDLATFDGEDWERHLGFAARYRNSFSLGDGGLDVAVSYFYGHSREPRLVPVLPAAPPGGIPPGGIPPGGIPPGAVLPGGVPAGVTPQVRPHYDRIHQGAVELLYALQDLQLKFEGIWRHANDEDFFAFVGGFEYTLPNLFGFVDIGILAEYLHDHRSDNQPPTIFEDDVFAGVRIVFDDVGSTRLLAGVVIDVSDGGQLAALEFERRLRDDLLLSADARFAADIPATQPFAFLNNEAFVQAKLTKFF